MLIRYKDYLDLWLNGLKDEMLFWDNYMKNEGGEYFYDYKNRVESKRIFALEDDVPEEKIGKSYKFIDIGSGPFSNVGSITDKVHLDALYVDPLAYIYNMLKNRYELNDAMELRMGFVELLEKDFEPDSFDMVHMSNSLDHSFSPIDGIYQLLNICRIGGKVVLRHAENEAVNADYQGLHQWNLSLHNKENSFIIWRNGERYDICEIFSEYADIYLYPDEIEKEDQWVYNKVVLLKRGEVRIPENKYYDVMFRTVYTFLLDTLYKDIINMDRLVMDESIVMIQRNFHHKDLLKQKLHAENVHTIIIYGMGNVGKNLEYLLRKCGIKILATIDKKGKKCGRSDTVTLEECEDFNADRLVITLTKGYEDIKKELAEKIDEHKIISVTELLLSLPSVERI